MIGLVLIYGDLHGYFYTVFVYPRAYAVAGKSSDVFELCTLLLQTPLPIVMVLFGALAATPRYRWFVIASFVVGLVSCMLPMRPYTHYWSNAFPCISLVIGMAVDKISQSNQRLAWIYVGAIAVAVLPTACMRLSSNFHSPNTQTMARVAQAVDRVAPENANLTVCGPWNCEMIQYCSDLPSANRYCWLNQFQPMWIRILPDSIDTIFGEYLANPPTILAVEKSYFDVAIGKGEAPSGFENIRLIRLLCERYPYRVVETVDDYVVLVRELDPGRVAP